MGRERIQFEGSFGVPLAAYLDRPNGAIQAWALFAHCFTCSKNLRAVNVLSQTFNSAGIAVLRFDFTGLGESEGDFAETNFTGNVADLLKAAAYLETHHTAPQVLVGHSLGGAAVLQAAQSLPAVKAIATIGAPCDPAHVRHLIRNQESEIRESGEACVLLAGREFRIQRQFLEDLEGARMKRNLKSLRKALLICHAPLDDTVGIESAANLFQEARHPKSFLSLDSADHLLTNPADARYAGTVIAAWAGRYLNP